MGPKNVVQIITDNVANYVVAGKMLMERHPTIFLTPCAAHCLDLMLEDIGKIDFVKDIVESSKNITKFIYNHESLTCVDASTDFINIVPLGQLTKKLIKVLPF